MISRLRRTSWLRGTAAVAAGAATGTGFQPLNWWILVIPGLAALILLVRNASGRAAAGLGYLFGIGLFTTTISWVGVMGPPVAILLIAVMALWCLLAGWTIRCVSVLPGTPVWQAMVWTATEIGAATIPLGGFGWVRLAWTVVDTPWVGVLRWAGSIGTSFLVALASGLLVYVVSARGGSQRRASIVFVAELLVVALAGTMCVTVVSRDISHQRSVRTLVVQEEWTEPPAHTRWDMHARSPTIISPRQSWPSRSRGRRADRLPTWCCGRRTPPISIRFSISKVTRSL
ncbi:apolipoprotein N-acyltransferase [Cutibacterium acnes JCM 18918]|nr:apolipoprotein N-acyltransferase [Cutibacterium acnes JCM 18918]